MPLFPETLLLVKGRGKKKKEKSSTKQNSLRNFINIVGVVLCLI